MFHQFLFLLARSCRNPFSYAFISRHKRVPYTVRLLLRRAISAQTAADPATLEVVQRFTTSGPRRTQHHDQSRRRPLDL